MFSSTFNALRFVAPTAYTTARPFITQATRSAAMTANLSLSLTGAAPKVGEMTSQTLLNSTHNATEISSFVRYA